MRIFNMIAGALGAIAASAVSTPDLLQQSMVAPRTFRGATPSRKKGVNKDGLPSGYPGAKLQRKAMQKAVAVKHPRGLRLDGVTF